MVGLGNPGPEYERTRHNLGAMVVTLLAERHCERMRPSRGERSLVSEVRLGDRRVALAFPQTFMNDSGMAVARLVRRYGIDDLARLVVVHDELDLPSGVVRLKLGGGTAGHNGLRSLQQHLHDNGYARVRIGVGRPPGRQSGADYVLRAPGKAEKANLDVAVELAADAVGVIAAEGIDAAMNRYNARI
ncbi:MAG TPA: aminoacyl-tRNA hydrolase [Acidimicrobiales bacterium]|nr:aminoacyl-tRNA hydrolase [Acidimicrobiales bacterium]